MFKQKCFTAMISTLFGLSETKSGPKIRQVTQYTTTSLNHRASKTKQWIQHDMFAVQIYIRKN